MRYLTLILTIIVYSCHYQTGTNEIQETSKTDERIDSLFLNYRFGMTELEFNTHTKELNDKQLLSNFALDQRTNTTVEVKATFKNDSLRRLKLYFKLHNNTLNLSEAQQKDYFFTSLHSYYMIRYGVFEDVDKMMKYTRVKNLKVQLIEHFVVYTDISKSTY